MALHKRKNSDDTLIDLTPMIDGIFLLVIFFMLSTTFVMQPGIKIVLPQSVSKTTEKVENLIITITKDGKFYVNQEETDILSLRTKISSLLKETSPKTVLINADEDTKHKYVVQVLDVLKTLKITNFIIATKPVVVNKGQ